MLERLARLYALGTLDMSQSNESNTDDLDSTDEQPSALAVFGLRAVGPGATGGANADHRCVWLWPDLVDVWNLWISVQTQWRSDMGFRMGLDHSAVRVGLEFSGIKRSLWRESFGLVRVMELAALDAWAEKRGNGR